MNKTYPLVGFVLLLVIVLFMYLQQGSTENIQFSCNSDEDCLEGYMCYNPGECGLGPDGPVPCPLQDNLCHKGCETDSDCPNDAPRCLSAQWSDYAVFNLCFK